MSTNDATTTPPAATNDSATNKPTDIFEVMRREREEVLTKEDSLNRTLIESLYENLRLPLGLAFFVLGGMQNQLYAWSHDFASQDYVGVPVSNSFLGFTGTEWELTNLFGAQGSAILLALIGGYFLGEAIWKRDAEIHLDNKKLAAIGAMKDMPLPARNEIDSFLSAKRKWIPDFDEEIRSDHPHLYRIDRFLRSRASLPVMILLHTLVLTAIHYTWSQRYYEGEIFVAGVLHESVFWNWSWFLGAYSTYTALCLASFYFFYMRMKQKPAKMADRYRERMDKQRTRFNKLRKRRGEKDTYRLKRKYLALIDAIIKNEKELQFWEALE
jgi:hypothetical protein